MRGPWEIWKGTLKKPRRCYKRLLSPTIYMRMSASGEPIVCIFCKIISPIFSILSFLLHYPPRTSRYNICADEIWKASAVLRCYDIIGFVARLYLSRRHLLNSIPSRKTRKCQDLCRCKSFFAGAPSLPCKLNGIKFLRQVLTRELKSCDTFIQV